MIALPLVLLPGLDGTGHLFRRFVGAAPAIVAPRVVSYPPDEPRSYAELEAIVEASVPGGPFAIVAESFAGPLALRVAAKRPAGLVAVVLVATFVRAPTPWWMRPLRRLARPSLFRRPPPALLVRVLMTGFDADDALVSELRASIASVRAEVIAARVQAVLDVDATEQLAGCPVPLLYIAAEHDALLRDGIAAELVAVRPDLEVVSLPAPHLVLQTRPREAAAVVASFLERAHPPGSSRTHSS